MCFNHIQCTLYNDKKVLIYIFIQNKGVLFCKNYIYKGISVKLIKRYKSKNSPAIMKILYANKSTKEGIFSMPK